MMELNRRPRGIREVLKDGTLRPIPKGEVFYTRDDIFKTIRFQEDKIKHLNSKRCNGDKEPLLHPMKVNINHIHQNVFKEKDLENIIKIKTLLMQEIMHINDAASLLREQNLSISDILARSKARGTIFLGNYLPDRAIDRANPVGFINNDYSSLVPTKKTGAQGR